MPAWAGDSFAESILTWTDSNAVQEITVLSGVQIPHDHASHRVFYVATEDYRATRLVDEEVPPMGSGFLDGVNASLIGRGMDSDLRVGVLLTPVHAQAPDAEAALRLVEAVQRLYDVEVDTAELEQFAADVERYYRELETRLEELEQTETAEDRMYM